MGVDDILVRTRTADDVEPWTARAEGGDLPELRNFAAGRRRDWSSVLAARTSPWSNGQTEDHRRQQSREVLPGGRQSLSRSRPRSDGQRPGPMVTCSARSPPLRSHRSSDPTGSPYPGGQANI
jgi:hypothetical protein